jgi:hypothetical protein
MEKEVKQLLGVLAQILSEDERIKSDVLKSYKINREMICKK